MKITVPEALIDKVTGLRRATLLKKETLAQVFSCEFCKISKNTLFTEHLCSTACVYKEERKHGHFLITDAKAAVIRCFLQ